LPPLGLLYIAAVLGQEGFEVKVFDPHPHNDSEINKIIEYKPNIVGLSVLTTYTDRAKYIISLLKKDLNDTFFVVGGIHPTVLPEESLAFFEVDCVAIGEGEITMKELVTCINTDTSLSQVNGILYRQSNDVIKTPPRTLIEQLDTVPFPARHLVDFERYLFPPGIIRGVWSERSTTIITSRGCPFSCIWCGSQAIFGHRVRRRSVENVIKELGHLLRDFNIDTIWFIDDTFTVNKKWVYSFCEAIRANQLKFKWGCQAHVTTADEEMFLKMKEAGLVQLDFGVESGSNKVLKALKKNSNEDAIREAFKIAKRAGIRTLATFMFGNPSEEYEDVEKTFRLAKEIKPNFVSSFFLTPFPGTELMDMARSHEWISNVNYFEGGLKKKPMMKINFPEEELYKIRARFQKAFVFRNYVSLFSSYKFVIKALMLVLRYPFGIWYGLKTFMKTRVFDDLVFAFLIYYAEQKNKQ
jgi:radical SAM superfamily enzyme YgiQ (UPF0313 family)